MKASTLLASAIAVVLSGPQLALADCQTVSASDVAQDIQNCPSANNALKNNACNFGGAAIAESGGNTCASNGNNFGVLQLTRSNLTNTGILAEPISEFAGSEPSLHMGATGRQFQHQRRLSNARQQRQHQRYSGDGRDARGLLPIWPADLQKRPGFHAGEWRRMPDSRKWRNQSHRANPFQWQREFSTETTKAFAPGANRSRTRSTRRRRRATVQAAAGPTARAAGPRPAA